ncbi:sensor histidine kinase [Daejeonella lutea]|uniref:histidine kinase n=1 Tax=Daejeonella lutea TaxID=572036 RepID=A0A1T5A814_9SPHI|nr:GAF domain-containing protein [Daejeonella lutea]SKB31172.1 Signal transduction histidine kinase [Daejeonella lutea]
MSNSPIPENEVERLLNLAKLDLDYTDLKNDFEDIVAVASKVSGMDVSLINLIDPYTQWTVAKHGLDVDSMPREESVCQYTIMEDSSFEVADLSKDDRFKDRYYVSGSPNLKYYFGIPLTTKQGVNIGALCVLDPELKTISPDKIEILKLLASEVVNKLKQYHAMADLKSELSTANTRQKKIAQDVRDPLAGIIGITEILLEQECEPKENTIEYISLINESSQLILSITNHVLIDETEEANISPNEEFNMNILKGKLEKLYVPLAENKKIQLEFESQAYKNLFPIPKSSVLQIAGTLISTAINLLPSGETLKVVTDVDVQPLQNKLNIEVTGGTTPSNSTSKTLIKRVLDLAQNLAERSGGKVMVSGESEVIKYTFSLPYSA